MPTTTTKSAFWSGFRNGLTFNIGAIQFGVIFGVVAAEAGFDTLKVMSMATIVIAGAAQFTALVQMQENASVILVLAALFDVNLRMATYSASIG